MPFLASELDISYTVQGFHFSAFSLGTILAGLFGARVAWRIGRGNAFWLGMVGMISGAGLLVIGQNVLLTIGGIFVMGTVGSLLLVMVQAILSDHHQTHRAQALTESNVVAAAGATLIPLLVGSLEDVNIGWRGAVVIMCSYGVVLWVVFRRIDIPDPSAESRQAALTPSALPRRFWAYWAVIVFGVSIEWSVVFWGVEFLHTNTDLAKTTAASMMSIYFVAVVIARFLGSRLTKQIAITQLYVGAFVLTAIGFFPFWLSGDDIISGIALFVMGLGIANLFPFGLAIALDTVTEFQADRASARISLAAGLAIFSAPLVLGALADQSTIKNAYGVVVALLMISFVTIAWANRLKD